MLQCVENVATLSVQEGLTETLTAFSCPLRLQESPGIILSWPARGPEPNHLCFLLCTIDREKLEFIDLASRLFGSRCHKANPLSMWSEARWFSPQPGLSLPYITVAMTINHGDRINQSWGLIHAF